jgi:hypothetical protein
MEIKAEGALPVWVTKLLAEYGVYPQSFSKYGTEYRQSCEAAQRGMLKASEPVSEVRLAQGTRIARSLRKIAAGMAAVVRIVN